MKWHEENDGIKECFNCGSVEFETSRSRAFGATNLVACKRCRLEHLFRVAMHDDGVESLDEDETIRQIELVDERDEVALNHGNGILDLVENYRTDGRVLDVGCKFGDLLEAATRRGWDAVGLDVNDAFCDFVRKKGFEVHNTFLENLGDEVESFDLITLSHVLEHIERPDETLQAIRKRLKPGGMVYIETPDVSSPIAWAVYRERWLGVATPGHVWAFSQSTLTDTIGNQGFDVVWSNRWIPYAASDYPKSLKGQIRRFLFEAINRVGLGDIVGVLARRSA